MRRPATGAAAVRAFAAAAPERPWLFYPEGWDWRWVAWGDAVRRLSDLSRRLELAEGAPPPGRVVAFPYRPRPSAVLLDLTLQEAGWLSLPVPAPADASAAALEDLRRHLRGLSERAPTSLRPAAWVEDPEHPLLAAAEALPGLPSIRLPSRPPPGPEPTAEPAAVPKPEQASGGVVARGGAGPSGRLSSADLTTAAGRLDRLLRRQEDRRREILVTGRCLDDLGERLLVTWAVAAGAALVLAPESASAVGIAAWIRPTVFHGDTEEMEALAAAAGQHRLPWLARLWRRLLGQPAELPFGRLHTVFCRTGTFPPEVAAWPARGVEIRGAVVDAAGVIHAAARHSFVVHCEQMK